VAKEATIRVWAEEKINVGNFSNVVIGAEVSRQVADDDAVIDEELKVTLHERVEKFLAAERDELIESLTKDSQSS
jgi:hypothetical protein